MSSTRQKLLLPSLIVMILCICWSVFTRESLEQKGLASAFHSANELYKQGKYEEAKDTYETLLNQDMVSGNLYYNLGNCYFKLNKPGQAIINYERARDYIPLDKELLANLRYVQSQMEIPPSQDQSLSAELLRGLTGYFTVDQLMLCASLLLFLCALSMGIKLLTGRKLIWLRHTALISVILLALVSALAEMKYYKTQIQEFGVLITPQAECRFAPEENAVSRFRLCAGSQVQILERDSQWLRVKTAAGQIGWVQANIVGLI